MTPDQTMAGLFAQQWRLARIQLVNWGTFCGYHDFPLTTNREDGSAPVIMITGESGTGKSTLFDAKTAVLQRNNVRFNAASNAVARGRARGGSQRSVYSYVLGKQDDVLDEVTGEERESFLRSTSTPQWSAVVLGFVDTSGVSFSCARFWYLIQGGEEGDLKPHFLTMEGSLDPRLLGPALTQAPSRRIFAEIYPQAIYHETVSGFLLYTYEHLGIGEAGSGDNAMKLHERIQAGTPITDVDALFKELVIDEPTTYEYADKALAAFDESESVWQQMDEIRRKIDALSGIRETHETYRQQTERTGLLESLLGEVGGQAQTGTQDIPDPLSLVLTRRKGEVLDRATDEADACKTDQLAHRENLERELSTTQQELDEVSREVQEQGGDALDRRRAELADARTELKRRKDAFSELANLLKSVGHRQPEGETDYGQLAQESQTLLEGRDDEIKGLNDRLVDIRMEARELKSQSNEFEKQLAFYRSNHVNITPRMAQARHAMAEALGVPDEQLPYAAELIDVAEGQEEWRLAACIGYHSLAVRILVDARRLEDLSRAIDGLKLGHRVTFTGVDLSHAYQSQEAPGFLSSKMKVKPGTPFAGWLWSQMRGRDQDWLCVDGPKNLRGKGRRIDSAGQTREGMRGAHGYDPKTTLVIGFTNELLIAQLESQLDKTVHRLLALQKNDQGVQDEVRLLNRRCDVAAWVTQHAWKTLDVETALKQVDTLEEEIRQLEGNDALKQLIARRDTLRNTVAQTQRSIGAVIQELDRTDASLNRLADGRAKVSSCLAQAEKAGLVPSPQQEAEARRFIEGQEKGISPESGGDSWQALADSFDRVEEHVREDARGSLGTARQQSSMAGNSLSKTFKTYHDQWLGEDDPTGVDVASYPDYLRMLEELEANKLNEPRDEWLRTMYSQVGAALVPLSNAFSQDLRDIRNRMHPINQIMGQFDFGPEHGRLEISVRDRTAAVTGRLRRELNEFSELATKPEKAIGGDHYHQRLRDFMERLRIEHTRGDRGALNTKSLVRITVLAHYPEASGKPDNTFSSLDAKSGGETQELIAFILGAALLFCLGRNAEGLPAFSPVFLDEAFIKADEHFTRRAINALEGLGFQIVIAVPTSKVQAVEPVADQYVCVSKSHEGHSFISPLVRG